MIEKAFAITLPEEEWIEVAQENFYNAVDGKKMQQQTRVRLKQENNYLIVAFECNNDPYWQQSTYTEHNSALWNQEVFELFIAEGSDTPTRYLEIEINPTNALFVGWVENPTGEGDAMVLTMIPYEEAGIRHQITHTTADSWQGELHIPMALIASNHTHRPATYRLNFYRIIQLIPQKSPDWQCSADNASFQCLSSTMSGNPPRFHRPDSFGTLLLM